VVEGRVCPTLEDVVPRGASELVGGPPGRHARLGHVWWTPLRVLLLMTVVVCALGYAQKAPCRDTRNWTKEYQYTRMCYSDVVALYGQEGLSGGKLPYVDYPTEYPPIIGGAMEFAASFASLAAPSHPVYANAHGTTTVVGYTMDNRAAAFYDVTALLFLVAAVVSVLCTALTAGTTRIWDAALVALAPSMVLHLLTNWDILAVAFAAGGLLAWSRRAPRLAGILFGLGAATKFYPLLFLVPLGALCLRAGRIREFVRTVVATVVTTVAVWVPVWLVAGYFTGTQRTGDSILSSIFSGTSRGSLFGGGPGPANGALRFFHLNSQRPADWDSLAFGLTWLAGDRSTRAFGPTHLIVLLILAVIVAVAAYLLLVPPERRPAHIGAGIGRPVLGPYLFVGVTLAALVIAVVTPPTLTSIREHGMPVHTLNAVTFLVLALLLFGVVLIALLAPRRPRLPQLLFITVVAFLVTNKVYSPQYVLWLVPLAALARPRWGMFLVWQASEALVLFTRFMHFIFNDQNGRRGIDRGWFVGAVTLRDLVLLVFAALVIREIYQPELDVVRRAGLDDPAGGVLDGLPPPAVLQPVGSRPVSQVTAS
jgi:uncharacterized membrane protein